MRFIGDCYVEIEALDFIDDRWDNIVGADEDFGS